jgi:hypothetical protein
MTERRYSDDETAAIFRAATEGSQPPAPHSPAPPRHWRYAGVPCRGAVLLAGGALRVPGWARLRARQMEELAVQLVLPADSLWSDAETLPPP